MLVHHLCSRKRTMTRMTARDFVSFAVAIMAASIVLNSSFFSVGPSSCHAASVSRVSVSLGSPGRDGSFGYSYGLTSGAADHSGHVRHHEQPRTSRRHGGRRYFDFSGPYDNAIESEPFRLSGFGHHGRKHKRPFRPFELDSYPAASAVSTSILHHGIPGSDTAIAGNDLPPPPDPPLVISNGFRPSIPSHVLPRRPFAHHEPSGPPPPPPIGPNGRPIGSAAVIPPPSSPVAPYPAGAKRPPVETNLFALNYDESKLSGYNAAREAFLFAKRFYPEALAYTRKLD